MEIRNVFTLMFLPLVGGFKSYIRDGEETGSYHVIEMFQLRTITECHMRCEQNPNCMFIGVREGPDNFRYCSLMREKEIDQGTQNITDHDSPGVKPKVTIIKKIDEDVTMLSQIKNVSVPVDGQYGVWSNYTTCDVTCGGGWKFRNRTCDSPAPQNGGCDCVGASKESTACNTQSCPVNGNWGSWSSFGACSAACKGGNQKRTRQCNNPSSSSGGLDCLTKDGTSRSTVESETQVCNTQPCPVNGTWGTWTSFSQCSLTCGGGTKSRSRTCNSPPPSHGGADCTKQDGSASSGTETETQSCNSNSCPVNGAWGTWTSFSQCSSTCGGGTQSRSRTCNSPPPSHGGADCTKQDGSTSSGTETQTQSCNTNSCPVNGAWGTWTSFSQCSSTCGGGTQSRSRTCNSPPPSHGGADCKKQDGTTSSGTETQTQSCNTNSCPVNGAWGTWTSFSQCSLTCGGGTKSRSRTCNSPPPSHGGADCTKQDGSTSSGAETQTQSCNTNSCSVTYSCVFSPGGGNDYHSAGKLYKVACIAECIKRKKTDDTYNGVGVYADESISGCWCLKNMPNRNTAYTFKSCVLTPN